MSDLNWIMSEKKKTKIENLPLVTSVENWQCFHSERFCQEIVCYTSYKL